MAEVDANSRMTLRDWDRLADLAIKAKEDMTQPAAVRARFAKVATAAIDMRVEQCRKEQEVEGRG